ncbi:lipoprotein NlpI [Vibrio sp. SS-MA-C1-2]|uniref:lipoprotein NlpI n=1 Tax=Vibrio sp. SS-MA-C1-2 TaxID=2908646 RepID=UPI001F2466E6|nr:lipoprotein NlpI [Vibrio sp. SS-MA-C1-2]UJF19704.1 lipoprotein NlpI [Vibrio sp. SS-MA-C1-2]
MIRWNHIFISFSLLLLSGCASQQISPPLLAVPIQPTLKQEIKLAQIEQALYSDKKFDDQTLASIFYERGLLRDSIGLRDLAKLDFEQSLKYKSDQSNVFNAIGVYYTQSMQFDLAYESFDSAIDLNPEQHKFAQRNRGIALYYGGRPHLAFQDLNTVYQQDKSDPYSLIWLYFSELKLKPETALTQLKAEYNANYGDSWHWLITEFLTQDRSDKEIMSDLVSDVSSNRELAERLTEAYFYIAKREQAKGNHQYAVKLYKMALAGNVYDFIEHRYALLELQSLIYNKSRESVTARAPEKPISTVVPEGVKPKKTK